MECISSFSMCELICRDFNIDPIATYKTFFSQYKVINGVMRIKAGYNAVIVGIDQVERPYMLPNGCRNESALAEFDYTYIKTRKDLIDVIKESGVDIKTSKCKVSEGGGWYSNGIRYEYNGYYCEE